MRPVPASGRCRSGAGSVLGVSTFGFVPPSGRRGAGCPLRQPSMLAQISKPPTQATTATPIAHFIHILNAFGVR